MKHSLLNDDSIPKVMPEPTKETKEEPSGLEASKSFCHRCWDGQNDKHGECKNVRPVAAKERNSVPVSRNSERSETGNILTQWR